MARWRMPSAAIMVRVHAGQALFWLLLTIPAVTLWKDSVPFLVSISMCALVLSSLASMQAAKADANSPTCEQLDRLERKVETLQRMLATRR